MNCWLYDKVGIILDTMHYKPERLNYKQLGIRANNAMTRTGILIDHFLNMQTCNPPLSTAAFQEHHNDAKDLNRISFVQLSAPQPA